MTVWEIICDDVLHWAAEFQGEPFAAILCDPSYALSKKKKVDPDTPVEAEIETVGDLVKAYHSFQQWGDTGFMSKSWDTAIGFNPETWRALAEHLLPGGFLLVFASSRGWHRLACALEDSGLVIQPSIFNWRTREVVEVPFCLGWACGSSFPKASRIDTAIDKAAGKLEERKVVGTKRSGLNMNSNLNDDNWHKVDTGEEGKHLDITVPATNLARAWEGHRYGGQILKNALEPIIVAQKPWEGKRLDCIVETGAGTLNIEAARIGTADTRAPAYCMTSKDIGGGGFGSGQMNYDRDGSVAGSSSGRWPANFCLIHSPECRRVGVKRVKGTGTAMMGNTDKSVYAGSSLLTSKTEYTRDEHGYADSDGLETIDGWRCTEGCPIRKLGEQGGESISSGGSGQATLEARGRHFKISKGDYHAAGLGGYGDKGTCARFFYQADWEYECTENCPVAKLDEQAGKRKSGYMKPGQQRKATLGKGGYHNGFPDDATLRGTYGDSGGPSRFYRNVDWSHEIAEGLAGADPVRYCPKAAKRERNQSLNDFYWRIDKSAPIGFARIGRDEWEALGEEEERIYKETGKRVSLRAQGNIHSTVKPISLNVWLATLLLPPKEYAPRRILIPFCGTMSEGIGALLAGWEESRH